MQEDNDTSIQTKPKNKGENCNAGSMTCPQPSPTPTVFDHPAIVFSMNRDADSDHLSVYDF